VRIVFGISSRRSNNGVNRRRRSESRMVRQSAAARLRLTLWVRHEVV